MANGKKILDLLLNTINDVQQKNQANPREETADPNVFDLLKNRLAKLDQKQKAKRVQKGKSPISFLDRVKNEIEGARRDNKKDPNQKTAPSSIFDNIIKKIDQGPKRQASSGLRKIVVDYNIDLNGVPRNIIQQVQAKYIEDRKRFDQQYAQALNELSQKY